MIGQKDIISWDLPNVGKKESGTPNASQVDRTSGTENGMHRV